MTDAARRPNQGSNHRTLLGQSLRQMTSEKPAGSRHEYRWPRVFLLCPGLLSSWSCRNRCSDAIKHLKNTTPHLTWDRRGKVLLDALVKKMDEVPHARVRLYSAQHELECVPNRAGTQLQPLFYRHKPARQSLRERSE